MNNLLNTIFLEDNMITMSRMDDKSISGIICSPPYNIGTLRKDGYYNNGYSDIDNLSEEDYIELRIKEFQEFQRILNDDGVICYNISYHNGNPILPTLLMAEIHKRTDLTIADIISWKKKTALPFQSSSTKLSRICELIYVIVKKSHLNKFKTNKKVSKINEKTNQKFYKHYTNYIEASNNDRISSKLKAAYSEDMVTKLLNIYFPEKSVIYDPFSGIGTTARACIKSDRFYIGSEINEDFYIQSTNLINSRKMEVSPS